MLRRMCWLFDVSLRKNVQVSRYHLQIVGLLIVEENTLSWLWNGHRWTGRHPVCVVRIYTPSSTSLNASWRISEKNMEKSDCASTQPYLTPSAHVGLNKSRFVLTFNVYVSNLITCNTFSLLIIACILWILWKLSATYLRAIIVIFIIWYEWYHKEM